MIKKITMSFNKEDIESIIKELNIRISELKKEMDSSPELTLYLKLRIESIEELIVKFENYLYKY